MLRNFFDLKILLFKNSVELFNEFCPCNHTLVIDFHWKTPPKVCKKHWLDHITVKLSEVNILCTQQGRKTGTLKVERKKPAKIDRNDVENFFHRRWKKSEKQSKKKRFPNYF